ncbi:MAG: hypothetical protein IJH75_04825 [Mogibacterium sp.]|nr:hypothetical protein [Mogibacterium sp.]
MKKIFREYLFDKQILVSEGTGPDPHAAETVLALAELFGIRVVRGAAAAEPSMIAFASEQLGTKVPEPFYRGFPQSVLELSQDALLADQILHYIRTYGLGDFTEPGHSVLEQQFERLAYREDHPLRDFTILSEEEACRLLLSDMQSLLQGSRPLSDRQFEVMCEWVRVYDPVIEHCASRNTAIRLATALREPDFARFLNLSDVIKVLAELQYRVYGSDEIRKLNLKNRDRKFLARLIDRLTEDPACDIRNCCERRQDWNGLLHHLHYKPVNEGGRRLTEAMRSGENRSVYAAFERAMADGDIREAVRILRSGKGSGAVLRSLDYILSRTESEEDLQFVLGSIETKNAVILLQLFMKYACELPAESPRAFQFTRFGLLKVHRETEEECRGRKSRLTAAQSAAVRAFVAARLQKVLSGRLGRVWIDPEMKRMAVPLHESASQGGFGVLACGSRLAIPAGRKIRAFTYWEQVHDVDLSAIGLSEEGAQIAEFSWRKMFRKQSKAITFSGDVTNGYNGGSEYFDLDPERFRKRYPQIRYLIFCDNVFYGPTYDKCLCKAGYMLRDVPDSGEIFEPKTVQTSFLINCRSRLAYLFGIDLVRNDFVWLNIGAGSNSAVAGDTDLTFLIPQFHATDAFSLYDLFRLMASEVAGEPADAEVIVSDDSAYLPPEQPGLGPEVIRSRDFGRILALLEE